MKIFRVLVYAVFLILPYAFLPAEDICSAADSIVCPFSEEKSIHTKAAVYEYDDDSRSTEPVFETVEESCDFNIYIYVFSGFCNNDLWTRPFIGRNFCISGFSPFIHYTEYCTGDRAPPCMEYLVPVFRRLPFPAA